MKVTELIANVKHTEPEERPIDILDELLDFIKMKYKIQPSGKCECNGFKCRCCSGFAKTYPELCGDASSIPCPDCFGIQISLSWIEAARVFNGEY